MQLSDLEVRILGCLIEKEATTPEASLDEVRRELAALRERFDEFTRQFS